MGDFNINLLKHGQHLPTSEFLDLITSNGLLPQITNPSCITSRSQTPIDNTFINKSDGQLISGNITTSISDHLPQFLLIEYEQRTKNKTTINLTKRNYKNFDKENFILDLLAIDWEQTLELNKKSVNHSFNNFFKV